MVSYPIRVKGDAYRGADPKKKAKAAEINRIAAALERAINDILEAQREPIKTYSYFEIAQRAGFSVKVVEKLCFSIDSGGNGFTAIRKSTSYEDAILENNS